MIIMKKSLYKNSFLFIFVQVTVLVIQSFEVFFFGCGPLSSDFFLRFWAIKFKFSLFVNYETIEKTTQFCCDDWQTTVTD